ncbi:MAG: flagellar biosynthetic protein FliR [Pseudomonadota bacterium]
MDQAAFLSILEDGFENFYFVMLYSMVRCFGLTWGFFAFSWAMGPSILLRTAISAAFSLPVLVINMENIATFTQTANSFELFLAVPKEFIIGLGFGFLASFPFRAMQYAGAVTDAYRGEADSGLFDPDKNPLQTFSLLYLIIGFYVFFALGGLWRLIETLYETYDIWPIDLTFPQLSSSSLQLVINGIQASLELAVVICAPLLILLMSAEFILMISAKLARRFGLFDSSFLIKNLITIATLPLTALLMVRVAETYTPEAILGFDVLKQLFQ